MPLFCLRRSACSLARASRSALKLRLCGFAATFSVFGATGSAGFASSLATAGLAGSDFSAFFSALTFGAAGFASTFGAAAGLKLAAIFAATASSTLDEWLFTSKPNSFARATTSLLSFPSSFAISYNLFLDKSCPPLLFHKRPHFLCKSSICYSQNLSRFPDCYA